MPRLITIQPGRDLLAPGIRIFIFISTSRTSRLVAVGRRRSFDRRTQRRSVCARRIRLWLRRSGGEVCVAVS